MIVYALFVLAVGAERLVEMVVSKRHLTWALRHGGKEYGGGHYPAMVVLHTALLIGCVVEVWIMDRPFLPVLGWTMVALVLASQALRWWCITTLGQRWNTRIVVIPGLRLVDGGPYRWFRHPNYVAVVVEGVALPMVHTAWMTAVAFTVLNAWLLRVRIKAENAALTLAAAAPPAQAAQTPAAQTPAAPSATRSTGSTSPRTSPAS